MHLILIRRTSNLFTVVWVTWAKDSLPNACSGFVLSSDSGVGSWEVLYKMFGSVFMSNCEYRDTCFSFARYCYWSETWSSLHTQYTLWILLYCFGDVSHVSFAVGLFLRPNRPSLRFFFQSLSLCCFNYDCYSFSCSFLCKPRLPFPLCPPMRMVTWFNCGRHPVHLNSLPRPPRLLHFTPQFFTVLPTTAPPLSLWSIISQRTALIHCETWCGTAQNIESRTMARRGVALGVCHKAGYHWPFHEIGAVFQPPNWRCKYGLVDRDVPECWTTESL